MSDDKSIIRTVSSFGSPISRRRLLHASAQAAVGLSVVPSLASASLSDGAIGGDIDYFW